MDKFSIIVICISLVTAIVFCIGMAENARQRKREKTALIIFDLALVLAVAGLSYSIYNIFNF